MSDNDAISMQDQNKENNQENEKEQTMESLLGEYHNNKFITEIEKRYGQGYIEKVIKSLKELGDPLAIDALYFVDRDEPQLKKNLL